MTIYSGSLLRGLVLTLAISALIGTHLVAQGPSKDPASSYLNYRRSLAAATKLENLSHLVSERRRIELQGLSEAEKAIQFNTIKATDDIQNIVVTGSTCNGTTCELRVTGTSAIAVGGKKRGLVGAIVMVKEGALFFLDSETWRLV